MEMTNLKDVEKGLSDEEADKLLPLLCHTRHDGPTQNGGHGQRPPRPKDFGEFEFKNHGSNLRLQIQTPSSAASTTNNTPDTATEWPRKWRRSDRRLRRLNTELLEAIEEHKDEEVERLLKVGANPNATCRLDLVSACHMAAMAGGDSMGLLLKHGAEKERKDRLGRTPLHLATWAGNARQVAIMLDFPEDMQSRVENEDMLSEAEEEIRKLCPITRELVNAQSDLEIVKAKLPKHWKDNIDHNCKDITGTLPVIQPGWTSLHIAASYARRHCARLLLAAGADPNITDIAGRTVLDVVGSAFYYDNDISSDDFLAVIRMLMKVGGTFNTMRIHGINNLDTPLHTAVELDCSEAIEELLTAGAAINCLNTAGLTPLHVCVKKELEDALHILANNSSTLIDPLQAMVDVKDRDGHTVLQAAIESAWVPGVCVALEAGADVTLKANDGDTPIHSAAALGNVDVLHEILSVAKQKEAIDAQNTEGETALFKATSNGHLECVRAILTEGASIDIKLPGEVNVLHVAADYGHCEVLKELLDFNETATQNMINAVTAGDKRGFGPIHFAVANNNIDSVDLLISKNADIRLRTTCSPHKSSTPLHITAVKNYVDIAKLILKYDKTTIYEVNSMGWFPLHTASHHGSREVITVLLSEGADLSGYTDGPKKYRRTALDMILNNLSKPTEFLEETFDSYISTNNYNLQDTNSVVTVDYRILMPTVCEQEQMKVIEALLKTGNRYGQKKLLLHPLIESFLYLKWKALLPFFYTIILCYALFLLALTIFTIAVYFYNDTQEERPVWLDPAIWGYIVCVTSFMVLIQELLYMNVKSSRYFLQLETWVKFGSLGTTMLLIPAILVTKWSEAEWPRHIATAAMLLSWLEMMFLLSRFPNWGYYVLMFGKVASNVVKILLTFGFLVIGFSLSFMIQFRSQMPFETPWAALVKTMVMMTSEFDYEALFDEEHSKELATSLIIVRVIFLIFLILAAIVLMNLMVGVAVNDINDLEILGNINRLAKQVEFLSTLDTIVYNRIFKGILPRKVNEGIKNKRKVSRKMTLCPGKPRWRNQKILQSHIRDAILNKAQEQKKQMHDEQDFKAFRSLLYEIHEALVKSNDVKQLTEEDKVGKRKEKQEEIMKHMRSVENGLSAMKDQINTYTEESKSPIEALHVKMDEMCLEIESLKMFLNRLESKVGRLH